MAGLLVAPSKPPDWLEEVVEIRLQPPSATVQQVSERITGIERLGVLALAFDVRGCAPLFWVL